EYKQVSRVQSTEVACEYGRYVWFVCFISFHGHMCWGAIEPLLINIYIFVRKHHHIPYLSIFILPFAHTLHSSTLHFWLDANCISLPQYLYCRNSHHCPCIYLYISTSNAHHCPCIYLYISTSNACCVQQL